MTCSSTPRRRATDPRVTSLEEPIADACRHTTQLERRADRLLVEAERTRFELVTELELLRSVTGST